MAGRTCGHDEDSQEDCAVEAAVERGQRAAQGPAQPSKLPGLGEIPAILRIREIDHSFPLLSCKGHSGLVSSCVRVPREGDRFRGSQRGEPRSKCGKGLEMEKLPPSTLNQS